MSVEARGGNRYFLTFKDDLSRYGYIYMKKLHADGFLESLDACEPCLMGKMTKTPFSETMERATDLLEIIHTDVCDPMSVDAHGRYRYFLTFTR